MASQAIDGGGGSVTFNGDLGDHFEKGRSLEWSPHGTQLLVIGEHNGVGWIATTDLEGADVRLLRTAEEARWLPNGSQMVLRVSSQEVRGMGIMNADATGFRYLFYTDRGSGAGYYPAPSPEGHRVAYAVPLLNRCPRHQCGRSPHEGLLLVRGNSGRYLLAADLATFRIRRRGPRAHLRERSRMVRRRGNHQWLLVVAARHLLPCGVGYWGPNGPGSWSGPSPTWNLRNPTASPMMTQSEHEPEINGSPMRGSRADATRRTFPFFPSRRRCDAVPCRRPSATRALDLPRATTDTFTDDDGSVHENRRSSRSPLPGSREVATLWTSPLLPR